MYKYALIYVSIIDNYVLCILCFMFLITMFIGSDSLFLHITLHMCGQLQILKANFMNFDVTSPKVYERFNALILRHDHLIRMTRKLVEAISFVLTVQLFISSMLIIIVGEYVSIWHRELIEKCYKTLYYLGIPLQDSNLSLP